jgi:predicted Zn-dependent protease
MKKTTALLSLLVLTLVLGFAGLARAEPFINHETKLQVTAPDDWKAEPGEDSLSITAPDAEAVVVMMAVDAADINAAVQGMSEELAKIVTDIKVNEEIKEHEVDGMKAASFSGTAVHENTNVEFHIAIVDAGDKCLIVFAYGSKDGIATHTDAINGIFESIKKSN